MKTIINNKPNAVFTELSFCETYEEEVATIQAGGLVFTDFGVLHSFFNGKLFGDSRWGGKFSWDGENYRYYSTNKNGL